MLTTIATTAHAHQPHEWARITAQRDALLATARSATQLRAPVSDSKKPHIPLVWSARINQTTWLNGVEQTSIVPIDITYIMEDSIRRRTATANRCEFKWAPAAFVGTGLDYINMTQYNENNFCGMLLNGQPLDMSMYARPFSPFFSWLAGAADGGLVPHNGTMMQSWVLNTSQGAANYYFELLVDADNHPALVTQNMTGVPPPCSSEPRTRNIATSRCPAVCAHGRPHLALPCTGRYGPDAFIREEFLEWAGDESLLPRVWDGFNESAFATPPKCAAPADPKPADTRMFIFHPKDNFNISGQARAPIKTKAPLTRPCPSPRCRAFRTWATPRATSSSCASTCSRTRRPPWIITISGSRAGTCTTTRRWVSTKTATTTRLNALAPTTGSWATRRRRGSVRAGDSSSPLSRRLLSRGRRLLQARRMAASARRTPRRASGGRCRSVAAARAARRSRAASARGRRSASRRSTPSACSTCWASRRRAPPTCARPSPRRARSSSARSRRTTPPRAAARHSRSDPPGRCPSRRWRGAARRA